MCDIFVCQLLFVQARKDVERAIGCVQGRLKSIRKGVRMEYQKTSMHKTIIELAFILHNMILELYGHYSVAERDGDDNIMDPYAMIHEFDDELQDEHKWQKYTLDQRRHNWGEAIDTPEHIRMQAALISLQAKNM